MGFGKATAIFKNINSPEYTVEEKKEAIKTVLGMETHNGITKKEILTVLKWSIDPIIPRWMEMVRGNVV